MFVLRTRAQAFPTPLLSRRELFEAIGQRLQVAELPQALEARIWSLSVLGAQELDAQEVPEVVVEVSQEARALHGQVEVVEDPEPERGA